MLVTDFPVVPEASTNSADPIMRNRAPTKMNELPTEVLLMTIQDLNDPCDLHAFIMAYRKAWALFTEDQLAALFALLQRSHLGRQNQRRLLRLLAMRCFPTDTRFLLSLVDDSSGIEPFDIRSCAAKLMQSMQPLQFLSEAARISKDVTRVEESLLRTMLNKANTMIQVAEQAGQQLCGHSRISPSRIPCLPSRIEIHRIRRALWHLLLFFEHCNRPCNRSLRQMMLFSYVEPWELEEMDCVYYHLQRRPHLWHQACPHCAAQFLPDHLFQHICTCKRAEEVHDRKQSPNSYSRFPKCFPDACRFFRIILKGTPAGLLNDEDEPGAGYSAVAKRIEVRRLDWRKWATRRAPLSCFLEWGYCIWDREKLQAWRLIDDPERGTRADFDCWTDGVGRMDYCAHCVLWSDPYSLHNFSFDEDDDSFGRFCCG